MSNPFSLTFGKEPVNMIPRYLQDSEIIESFSSENPDYQVCMLTGVRGAGKTVSLTSISNQIRKKPEWIVIDLNPERDLLHALAVELSNQRELFQIFKDAKINVSFMGLGLEMDGTPPITDVVVALDRMLEKLTQKNKKVLITIDEASANSFIREFSSQFQIFMRKNYQVFLLMTGLYENIYELQNEKTLTFLYRAPKIELKPLKISVIAERYQEIFQLEEEEALEMAKVTKGYPFAFQVLGYLCYKRERDWKRVLPEFDAYLEEYVYEKIWSELSGKDRSVLIAMSKTSETKVEYLRQESGMNSNTFTVYRKRLLKKGIIRAAGYGHLEFVLPRFREFIRRNVFI